MGNDHSNAYFFGVFGKKMIVLYDTLLKQMDNIEIMGVVCHEIGHWYHWHNVMLKVLTFLQILTFLVISKLFIFEEDMYTSFGFQKKELVIGFFLFQMFLTPVSVVLSV